MGSVSKNSGSKLLGASCYQEDESFPLQQPRFKRPCCSCSHMLTSEHDDNGCRRGNCFSNDRQW